MSRSSELELKSWSDITRDVSPYSFSKTDTKFVFWKLTFYCWAVNIFFPHNVILLPECEGAGDSLCSPLHWGFLGITSAGAGELKSRRSKTRMAGDREPHASLLEKRKQSQGNLLFHLCCYF